MATLRLKLDLTIKIDEWAEKTGLPDALKKRDPASHR